MKNLSNKSRFDDCEIIGRLVAENVISAETGKKIVETNKLPDDMQVTVTKTGGTTIRFRI